MRPSINDVITSKEEGFGNKIGTKIRNTIPALVRFVIKTKLSKFPDIVSFLTASKLPRGPKIYLHRGLQKILLNKYY